MIASLPSGLAARVDHVGVRGIDQVTLTMRSGATVLWGSDAQSALKAEVLVRLLAQPGAHLRRQRPRPARHQLTGQACFREEYAGTRRVCAD